MNNKTICMKFSCGLYFSKMTIAISSHREKQAWIKQSINVIE